MSTADILSLVSLISYIAAGLFLVLTVFFWFAFKIPSVIGDLSGRTAKKSIAKMRQANTRTGNKSYRPSATNAARGKLTDTMPQAPRPQKANAPVRPVAGTGSLETEPLVQSPHSNETEPLVQSQHGNETVPLDTAEAMELLADDGGTMPLNVEAAPPRQPGGKKLTMINEVMLIHTNEVIG